MSAVRLVPIPRQAPLRAGSEPVPAGQGALALELAAAVPPDPEPRASAWLGDDEPTNPPDIEALPDPRRWTAMIAQAVVEILAGRRPVTQVLRWVDPEIYRRIQRSAPPRPGGRGGVPVRVRRVRVSTSPEGAVEAVAVVDDGTRCRAMTLRLEALERRWLCTALDIV